MPTPEELVRLLAAPNEGLSLEYKSWLDLSGNAGKAILAKAAIALANQGGGVVVLGMRPTENGPLASQQRPGGVGRYSQDEVNSAINRFADPEVHCELAFAAHPESGVEHAFVIVPGGATVPIMSTRDYQGEIAARCCYVRKPGPRSEEAFTAEEWRGVVERCVQARREDMLGAIRMIVEGGPPEPESSEHDALEEFIDRARDRWRQLIVPSPPDDPCRMPYGHYELCFEIEGVDIDGFAALRRALEQASEVKHSGWPPFIFMTRQEFAPRLVDQAIEAWTGVPGVQRIVATGPQHCDYWRATCDGLLFLQRGLDEDGSNRVEPGRVVDVQLPIHRIGETLLFVSRLGKLLATDPGIYMRAYYFGLRGRTLASIHDAIHVRDGRVSADDRVVLEAQASATQCDDNVVEVLHAFLRPLYERFDFFELSRELVAHTMDRVRHNRF